ncbi:hypothetical protein [Actinophytocola sp.]
MTGPVRPHLSMSLAASVAADGRSTGFAVCPSRLIPWNRVRRLDK